MKAFVAPYLFLASVGISQAIHEKIIQAKWATYKTQHGKEYHPTEESTRLANYLQSTLDIETHNLRFHRGEVGYELGHNHLSDMTHEEVKTKMLGKRSMSLEGRNFTDVPPMAMPSMPSKVDWREYGIVTPPKTQGDCGSCYAFGTVGVIESAILQKRPKKTGTLLDLAEQQVVDCSYHVRNSFNNGCQGGHELVVMDHVGKFGVLAEKSYTYTSGRTGKHGACKQRDGHFGKGLKYRRIPPGNENTVAQVLAKFGTLVISISGENRDFQLFRGGIYDNPSCPKTVDHVVSLVGFGEQNGRKYWIIKNSWGSTWGENGFGRILRGVNQCGIVSDNSWSIQM